MGSLLDRLLRRDASERVIECRRCGTTLEQTGEECPTCGSLEAVVYDVT